MTVDTLILDYPRFKVEFELLELGKETSIRHPGSALFDHMVAVEAVWENAADDREEFRIEGTTAFRVGDGPIVSVGTGAILKIGYQEGHRVASLLNGIRHELADYADGRWQWYGGPERDPWLRLGVPQALLGETVLSEITAPGIRSRNSGLAERELALA